MLGRCTCGTIRYRLTSDPIFVHCCHCRWCQRETGTAFVLNAMIEADRLEILDGTPVANKIPSASGQGQIVTRCPDCKVALWSNYGPPALRFVRVGTLENPDACPPDVHIYTSSKQPWVILPGDVPAFTEFYRRSEVWPQDKYRRREVALAEFKPDA